MFEYAWLSQQCSDEIFINKHTKQSPLLEMFRDMIMNGGNHTRNAITYFAKSSDLAVDITSKGDLNGSKI